MIPSPYWREEQYFQSSSSFSLVFSFSWNSFQESSDMGHTQCFHCMDYVILSVLHCHIESKGLHTWIKNWVVYGECSRDISTIYKFQVLHIPGGKVINGVGPWVWVPMSPNSSTSKFCWCGVLGWPNDPPTGKSLFHLLFMPTFLKLWALIGYGSRQETHF